MTAQKGKDLLLKIGDGDGGFVTVAGLRSNRIRFNAQTVDATDSDSAGRWRELLAGAGVKSAALSGAGLFRDAASDALARRIFFDGVIRTWRVVVPDFGSFEGPFQITALELSGRHDGEVVYDIALESAGEISFTAS